MLSICLIMMFLTLYSLLYLQLLQSSTQVVSVSGRGLNVVYSASASAGCCRMGPESGHYFFLPRGIWVSLRIFCKKRQVLLFSISLRDVVF
ncbi:hypothetical protein HDV62DRAFT_375099 [Trichoderma sp. SZMC 28011]